MSAAVGVTVTSKYRLCWRLRVVTQVAQCLLQLVFHITVLSSIWPLPSLFEIGGCSACLVSVLLSQKVKRPAFLGHRGPCAAALQVVGFRKLLLHSGLGHSSASCLQRQCQQDCYRKQRVISAEPVRAAYATDARRRKDGNPQKDPRTHRASCTEPPVAKQQTPPHGQAETCQGGASARRVKCYTTPTSRTSLGQTVASDPVLIACLCYTTADYQ